MNIKNILVTLYINSFTELLILELQIVTLKYKPMIKVKYFPQFYFFHQNRNPPLREPLSGLLV